jgi:hypothetical protein
MHTDKHMHTRTHADEKKKRYEERGRDSGGKGGGQVRGGLYALLALLALLVPKG